MTFAFHVTFDNVDEVYNHLIKADEETNLSILLKKRKRAKYVPLSVSEARNNLKNAI